MWVALAINGVLLLAEVVGGILTGSLAVLADAGHLLSDVGSIVLALIAARLASLPARGRRTFGYQRSEVLAALVNGLLLVAVSIGIAIAAIGRLSDPPGIDGRRRPRARRPRPRRQPRRDPGPRPRPARGHQPRGRAAPQLRRRARLARRRPRRRLRPARRLRHRRPDRRPADRRPRPRLLLAPDQGALRGADGGRAGRPRRRCDGRRDLRRGGGALRPRPPCLDRHRRLRRAGRPRRRRSGPRSRPGLPPARADAGASGSGSSTRPCRWRRRPTRPCCRSRTRPAKG